MIRGETSTVVTRGSSRSVRGGRSRRGRSTTSVSKGAESLRWARFNGTTTYGQFSSAVAATMGDVNGNFWFCLETKATSGGLLAVTSTTFPGSLRYLRKETANNHLNNFVRASNFTTALDGESVDDVFDGDPHLVIVVSEDTGTNANAYNAIDGGSEDNDGVELRQAMGIGYATAAMIGRAGSSFLDGLVGFFACGNGDLRGSGGLALVASAYAAGGRRALASALAAAPGGTTVNFAQVLDGVTPPEYNVGGIEIVWTDVDYVEP